MDSNLLARIANPQGADPTAYVRGAQAGNALAGLSAAREGGNLLAQGDLPGANALALRAGQPQLATQFSTASGDQSKAVLMQGIAEMTQAAQSPQTWEAFRQRGIAAGHDLGDFTQAQKAIAAAQASYAGVVDPSAAAGRAQQESQFGQTLDLQRQTLDLQRNAPVIVPAGSSAITKGGGPGGDRSTIVSSPPAPQAGYRNNPDGTQSFIPGSAADPANRPLNEAQLRARQLYNVTEPELGTVKTVWSDLTAPKNQVMRATPDAVKNFTTSEGYQRGVNAIAQIYTNYLYQVSGAAVNPSEAITQARLLMPSLGEAKGSIADKYARVQRMVDSIRIASTQPGTAAGSPSAVEAMPSQSAGNAATPGGTQVQAGSQQNPIQVGTPQDADRLPSGTYFSRPDKPGRLFQVP